LAAILPTPADASYPKPKGDSPIFASQKSGQSPILSTIGRIITAGPRNGPRHLLDSNIDWGQDLFYLKDWLEKHPDVKLDGLAVWGSYPATLAGIPETPMPPAGPMEIRGQSHFRDNKAKLDDSTAVATKIGTVPGPHPSSISGREAGEFVPRPGWYAVSVNYIYGRDQQYRYFLNFEPVATAGYSIYIYQITPEEANRVQRQAGLIVSHPAPFLAEHLPDLFFDLGLR
jgi:hypothetical protein